ncbi:MAG: HEAT repeat domain-containing protein [Gammaproteobacteria bacterium]|nr:HEAT repeat domain-containing protein [Gammaproteobacteria bacterium]
MRFELPDIDEMTDDFVSRGIVVLGPEHLGVPMELHERIYEQEKAAFHAKRYITTSLIPDVLEVLKAPGVVAACDALVGENWAILPFTHNAPFVSGGRDQHWHKDDNGPYNARRHRHHHAVQIEMLYYPQAVAQDMGPTATVPYSQYWTFNHEENHDNFAGADHLDFAYQLSGMETQPASGPRSRYADDDIVHRRTEHDRRMRDAVGALEWPLNKPWEAAPLKAGSVVIYSHNLIHRGNHRRDDWRTWKDNPRFMWRFWLYRTTEPTGKPAPWQMPGKDALTGLDRSNAPEDLREVWRHQSHWLRSGSAPRATDTGDGEVAPEELATRLRHKDDRGEPVRIGAAYRLAAGADSALAARILGGALRDERESVRRAAVYGLAALGSPATDTLLDASRSAAKWVRKAGTFGLGEAGALRADVLEALAERLRQDASVYVRSVAADALGSFGRRAVAAGRGPELMPAVLDALIESLGREENRLAMDRAQNRSIKLVRPADESDVCEGIGIDYQVPRYAPVRSVVRENALSATVTLCSHGAALAGQVLERLIESLTDIVREERNVFCVGLAMDALARLAHLHRTSVEPVAIAHLRAELPTILAASPIICWDALGRVGLSPPAASDAQRTPEVPFLKQARAKA